MERNPIPKPHPGGAFWYTAGPALLVTPTGLRPPSPAGQAGRGRTTPRRPSPGRSPTGPAAGSSSEAVSGDGPERRLGHPLPPQGAGGRRRGGESQLVAADPLAGAG